MDAEPLSKAIYDKAKKLGIESITLHFSGGSDNGFLEIDTEPNFSPSKGTWASAGTNLKFLNDVEEWAWKVYNYNGAGDGLDYGDDVTYDLKNKKVSMSAWYLTRHDENEGEKELKIAGNSNLDDYSASKIMRRCGQLGIPYEKVISSLYGKSKGWRLGKCLKQHKEGIAGTIGWGKKMRPLPEKDSTPHTLEQMKSLLGKL